MKRLLGGILALGLSLGALAHGSIVELSVHDRSEGRRLPVHWHQGRAHVVGKPGNEYQVVLRNRTGEEVLAVVSVDSPAQFVRFERASHAPAEVLSLYYDSRASLLARGVIREAVPVAPLPRPFPGFVPDPRG